MGGVLLRAHFGESFSFMFYVLFRDLSQKNPRCP